MTDSPTRDPERHGPQRHGPERHGASARQRLGRLIVLMVAAFVDTLGAFLILALLPYYAERYGASPTEIGFLVSVFAIAQLVTAPLWGRLSDRSGRRPVIILGLLVSAISYAVFAFADSLLWLLVSRVAQGIGGGTVSVIFAYVSDSLEPDRRAEGIGWLTSATSLAAMIGPAIGSWAGQWHATAPGLVVCALCVVALFFVLARLPESSSGAQREAARKRPRERGRTARALGRVVVHPLRELHALIWVYASGMLAMTALTAVVALYLERRFSVQEDRIWIFFAVLGGMSIVMRLLVLGPAVERFGEVRLLRTGAILLGVSLLLLPVPDGLWPMLGVSMLVPIATALLFPCTTALISRLAPSESDMGELMGVQQAFGGLSKIGAPLLAGAAFQAFGPASPFWIFGATMAAVGLATLGLRGRRERPGEAVGSASGNPR